MSAETTVKATAATKPFCCYQGCDRDAEFTIYAIGDGLDPYSNVTESCTEHVGPMLGTAMCDALQGHVATHWEVVPLVPQVQEEVDSE